MTTFDDYEPEDAWDPDDPAPIQITNLRRRLAVLIDSDDAWSGSLERELDLYDQVLALAEAHRLSPRSVLRIDDLRTDIGFVRRRLEQ